LCRVSREARFPSNRVGARVRDLRGSNDVSVGFAPLIGPGNSRCSICSSAVIGHGVVFKEYVVDITVSFAVYKTATSACGASEERTR
jgi:hypothetical protein